MSAQMDEPLQERVRLSGVAKSFVMHLQGGVGLPVVRDVSFGVNAGECVVLGGPSGAGKSSILKMIYGNYLADGGRIEIVDEAGRRHDIVTAPPRTILKLRQTTIGYVSQFLRVIPRVSARDVVAAEMNARVGDAATARREAGDLLARLNLPERLWDLPPSTFSGGEQQRVNIARGFAAARPVMLLDEPTASLDAANRAVVVDLIEERKRQGAAIIGIFHDQDVRDRVASRVVDVTAFAPERAA
jgi:alpha-D-ribose 1-methylphosphonate 5-triphosphate synthase subunit PhnL